PAHRVQVRDLPDGGLAPIAVPPTLPAHGVPGWLVRPVIVATAQREVLLLPDDLAADRELGGLEISRHERRLQPGVPDVRDRAREQLPCIRPVGAIVVRDAADRRALLRIDPMPPRRIVGDAIWRIRGHEDWRGAVQQPRHITGGCRVTTEQTMTGEL